MWHISTDPTNISSGVQAFRSPLNSGGLDIRRVGFPSEESVPDLPSVHTVQVLYVKDLVRAGACRAVSMVMSLSRVRAVKAIFRVYGIRPPASRIACRAGGNGSIRDEEPVVVLMIRSFSITRSSPSAAVRSGCHNKRQAEVDGVLEKDPGNTLRDNRQPVPFQCGHGLLPGGAAAEVACLQRMMLPGGICFAFSFALNAASSAKANCGVSDGSTVAM